MTQRDDILHAVSLGVDAIGLIFYPRSARCLTIDQAKVLLQGLPAFVDAVAVMVNPEASFVKQLMSELPIHLLQFHGDETASFCEQFKRPYIKALPAVSAAAITQAALQHPQAAALLLDTPSQTSRGGTGVPFDWRIIPQALKKPIILAGGLDASNVSLAIKQCAPFAVDVCSGIEVAVGRKDHDKMQQFIHTLWGDA